jgi:hypothetical protein
VHADGNDTKDSKNLMMKERVVKVLNDGLD